MNDDNVKIVIVTMPVELVQAGEKVMEDIYKKYNVEEEKQ